MGGASLPNGQGIASKGGGKGRMQTKVDSAYLWAIGPWSRFTVVSTGELLSVSNRSHYRFDGAPAAGILARADVDRFNRTVRSFEICACVRGPQTAVDVGSPVVAILPSLKFVQNLPPTLPLFLNCLFKLKRRVGRGENNTPLLPSHRRVEQAHKKSNVVKISVY